MVMLNTSFLPLLYLRQYFVCDGTNHAFAYLKAAYIFYDIRYLPCRLEKMVIDEINLLSAEYLDKDELEQNIEFCNNLQGQKKG